MGWTSETDGCPAFFNGFSNSSVISLFDLYKSPKWVAGQTLKIKKLGEARDIFAKFFPLTFSTKWQHLTNYVYLNWPFSWISNNYHSTKMKEHKLTAFSSFIYIANSICLFDSFIKKFYEPMYLSIIERFCLVENQRPLPCEYPLQELSTSTWRLFG